MNIKVLRSLTKPGIKREIGAVGKLGKIFSISDFKEMLSSNNDWEEII